MFQNTAFYVNTKKHIWHKNTNNSNVNSCEYFLTALHHSTPHLALSGSIWCRSVVINLFKPKISDLDLCERQDLPIEDLRKNRQHRMHFQLKAFY